MKIVGQLVCGPGEADRYLEETLKEFKRLCDTAVVCFCNAGPAEKALVYQYGYENYQDNREWGHHQPDIKTDLLKRILTLEPDWIMPLDADETLPTIKDRAALEALTENRVACQMYVVNLWNNPGRYRKSLGFWNVRFYKPGASPDTQFLRKPLHCGNAPPFFYNQPAKECYVPHILLHKGLMAPDSRARKADRYRTYDPDARHKGRMYYDALEDGADGSEYSEADVVAKITEFCEKIGV